MSPPRRRLTAQLNAVASAGAELTGKFSTFAWTVIAARLLTQEEFGAFMLALSLALTISAAAEWGFDPILMVRGSKEPGTLGRLYAQAMTWQIGIAVPVFAVAGAIAWATRPTEDARAALVLVLVAVFLDLWSDTARAVSAAARNQAGTAIAVSVQRLAAAVLIVGALVAGLGLVGMAVAFMAASVLGVLVHLRAIGRLGIRFERAAADRAGLRSMARGTFMVGLSGLLAMALFRIDSLLLAALEGDREVGEYAAAYRLFETVLFLAYAITGAVTPLVAARLHDLAEVRRLGELATAVLATVYVPFGVVCLAEAPVVLGLLYGDAYEAGAGALRWIAFAPVVYGVSQIAGMLLVSMDRSLGVLVGTAVALVLNVGLNVALIPPLGTAGAGLATTASFLVQAAITLAYLAAAGGRLPVVRAHLEPVLAALPLAALLALLDAPVLAEVPLALAVYAAAWLFLTRVRRPDVLRAVAGLVPGRSSGVG